MFVPPPVSATETAGATGAAPSAATHHIAGDIDSNNRVGDGSTSDGGTEAKTTPKDGVDGLAPNPLFTSNRLSPLCMDPGRVTLYRSLGFIVGLAVRTGVTLPLSHLSPKWWMLVSNDVSPSVEHASAVGGECSSRATRKAAGLTRSRSACPDVTNASNLTQERPPQSTVDGVLKLFSRLEEAGLEKEEIDEILADARFVAPLSNGHVTELLPGGEDCGECTFCITPHTFYCIVLPHTKIINIPQYIYCYYLYIEVVIGV